jgi:hypothetical protein
MRSVSLCFLILIGGCASAPQEPIASLQERLEAGLSLPIAAAESTGVITANRYSADGWLPGRSELVIEGGMLTVSAAAQDAIRVEQLSVEIAPIDLPPSVLGEGFALTDIRFRLARPVDMVAEWRNPDEARARMELELALDWSLRHDGSTAKLGSPRLAPVPVELTLVNVGGELHAELRALLRGELWNWADVIRLDDLDLTLAATTP